MMISEDQFDGESRRRLLCRLLRENQRRSTDRQRREKAVGAVLNVVMDAFVTAGVPVIYFPDNPKMKVILKDVIRLVHVLGI